MDADCCSRHAEPIAVRRTALAIYLLIAIGPIVVLAAHGLLQFTDPRARPELLAAGITLRQLRLLLSSAGFALLVAVSSTALGVLAATALWQWSRGSLRVLRYWFLLLLFIPPYLQAQAWMSALAATGTALGGTAAAISSHSWLVAWWVEATIYAPLAAGLAMLGLSAIDPLLLEAGRLSRSELSCWWRIALPLAMPQLTAAAGLVFLLSLADYGVPSLLQVNSYPLEIFAYFSSGGPVGGALLLSLPMLLIALTGLAAIIAGLRAMSLRPPSKHRPIAIALRWPWWLQLLQRMSLTVLGLQLAVPLAVFWRWAGSPAQAVRATVAASAELQVTLVIALAAGLLCLPLAYALARQLGRAETGQAWWLLALLPAALPAPLLAIGLIVVWNRPGFSLAYDSLLLPVLVVIARFTPVVALLILAQLKRLDTALLDAGRVFCPSAFQLWLRVRLPLYAPGLLAAALLMAALSTGELGGTLIVAPPGRATLAMRIYNYLHYGASESVAGLCLVLIAIALLLGVSGLLILGPGLDPRAKQLRSRP